MLFLAVKQKLTFLHKLVVYLLNVYYMRVYDVLAFPYQERKELVKGSYRDRHFNAGSILLAFGVFESIGGGVNTWFRTGKLFPGPHLFAGAGKIWTYFRKIKIK